MFLATLTLFFIAASGPALLLLVGFILRRVGAGHRAGALRLRGVAGLIETERLHHGSRKSLKAFQATPALVVHRPA